MRNILTYINTILIGFGMGAANIVPGVSGGTIALLTGIFGKLVESINSFMVPSTWKALLKGRFREFWNKINGSFLISLFIGVILSIALLSKLMEYVIAYYPVQTWAFFFGLICASSVYMLFDIKDWKTSDILYILAGLAVGAVICTVSPKQTPDDLWFIFICGAIAICTMILPGISGSFVLVLLSKYEYIINAINTLNLPVLFVFGAGCAIGILAFTKFLRWLLSKYEKQTLLALIGFVIGSLIKVWPWNDMNAVAQAHFMHNGFTPESAKEAVSSLLENGANLKTIVDLHVPGAVLWAVSGIVLVWALETVTRLKSSK